MNFLDACAIMALMLVQRINGPLAQCAENTITKITESWDLNN